MLRNHLLTGLGALFLSVAVCGEGVFAESSSETNVSSVDSVERHLTNIRQLTFGRKNAEAYFSFEGDMLIFQSTNNWSLGPDQQPVSSKESEPIGLDCYQMYTMDLDTGGIRLVSTGRGVTTCGYFFPGGRRVLYSSTHLAGTKCPPKPKRGKRYRWKLDDYDIFSVRVDNQQLQRLTATPGYDAEATIAPNGKSVVFTSMRDGDLDLYSMRLDGTHLKRLTHELGYDGGAFYSSDSKRIVYRASHPHNDKEVEEYTALLKQQLVEPGQLEIFVMNADGSNKVQVTKNGASNFAPFFHPDGRLIIFSSDMHSKKTTPVDQSVRPTFHLYLISDDGKHVEQVTHAGAFNSFPMFSPDGKQVVWVSDREATERGEFNIFLADWVP